MCIPTNKRLLPKFVDFVGYLDRVTVLLLLLLPFNRQYSLQIQTASTAFPFQTTTLYNIIFDQEREGEVKDTHSLFITADTKHLIYSFHSESRLEP